MGKTRNVWTSLSDGPLSVGEAYDFLTVPEAGGIAVFIGTTRRWTESEESETLTKETVRLCYEAYEPMALDELDRLAAEASEQWPVLQCYLSHRLGEVPVTEASVIVGAATAHRREAFAACRWLIDALKERVPIWKREVFADGTEEWVRPEGWNDVRF